MNFPTCESCEYFLDIAPIETFCKKEEICIMVDGNHFKDKSVYVARDFGCIFHSELEDK